MKQFRYLLITAIILLLACLTYGIAKSLELGYSRYDLIVRFFTIIICLFSCFALFHSVRRFNKSQFKSYLLVFISLMLTIPSFYISFKIAYRYLYEFNITHKFNISDFKLIDLPDKAQLNVLSYTNALECTTNSTYYYSVICINKATNDTIRVLTPCQVLLSDKNDVVFNRQKNENTKKVAKILDSLDLNFYNSPNKYILIDNDIQYQDGDYVVAIGSISYDNDL